MKTYDIPLKCNCSKLEGIVTQVSPKKGNHIVCMCIDCQTFAHYLGNEKKLLDKCGGTHIFQVTPSQIKFTKGEENLKCLKLSPKGANRWYASCCNTPIANTISLKMSFAGLILSIVDFESVKVTKSEALGAVKYYCKAKDAQERPPLNSHQDFPKWLTFKIMSQLLIGKINKSYLPNPFFKEETGDHVQAPIILGKEKRDELRLKISSKSD